MKKVKEKRTKSKKVVVDTRNIESVSLFKVELIKKWGFEHDLIHEVLSQYNMEIVEFSYDHATIMITLLEKHLGTMTEQQKRGYIASKKVNYKRLGDNTSPVFAFTVLSTLYTMLVSNSDLSVYSFLIYAALALFGLVVIKILSSGKPKFYGQIINSVEDMMIPSAAESKKH